MFPNHNIQPQGPSSLNRRAHSAGEEVELVKKPKKVNSEIRKQQNRIASRNYREKRKRKLQFLQQLVKDGDSPEQEPAQRAEQMHGQRVLTPEYMEQRPAAKSMILPSNEGYVASTSTTRGMANSMPATTSSAYDHHYRPSQQLPSYEHSWPVSMYEPMPPINISTWNVPNWMPSIDYTPPMTSRSDAFQFTPPHSHHSYDEISTPPQQARTPEPDLFLLGTCRSAGSYVTSTSLPSSTTTSPYRHMQYAHGL